MTFEDVKIYMEQEGIGYFILNYTTAEEMPDEKSKELFERTENALREFEEYINSQIN